MTNYARQPNQLGGFLILTAAWKDTRHSTEPSLRIDGDAVASRRLSPQAIGREPSQPVSSPASQITNRTVSPQPQNPTQGSLVGLSDLFEVSMSAEIIQFVPGLKYEDERAKLDRMIDLLESRGQPDVVISKYRRIRDKLLILPDSGDCA